MGDGDKICSDVHNTAKLPITVVVPVKNEESNISACLRRLRRFAEVIVVDSNSTDETVRIAEKFGVEVVQFSWNGKYPKKRNWLLMNRALSQEWVLFLDADELVNDEFCDAALAAIQNSKYDGYWLSYTNTFLGKKLKYGLEQKKLALFRATKGRYERIDEQSWSSLDMEVHEHPVIEGVIGEIGTPIDHQDYKGLYSFFGRHLEYARWEAHRHILLERDEKTWHHFTTRQKFKYRHLTKWWYPPFYFFHSYFLKRGFLDGYAGFQYALCKAWYFHSIRLLIKEAKSA